MKECEKCGARPFFVGDAEPDSCPFCVERDPRICGECGGATIDFRFAGRDAQYKLCSRWREPGHLSEQQWRGKLQSSLLASLPPSGRFA